LKPAYDRAHFPKKKEGIFEGAEPSQHAILARKVANMFEKPESMLGSAGLPEIERVIVDPTEIAKFTTEDDFLELAVQLMVETASYTGIAACTMGQSTTWDRDNAAVGGNMVRLYKLLHGVLDQTCQKLGENSLILTRLVYETLVNLRYLITNFSPELVDSYVRYSMRHERKLRDTINTNIEARNGTILPIEDRMLKSIRRTEAASQISLDDINMKDKGLWGGKTVYDKADAVGMGGMVYRAAFGGGSNSVHGNWQEINGHHLEWDERGHFEPKLTWARPRPQVLLALCRLVIETLVFYFEFMGGEAALELFAEALADIDGRVSAVVTSHEEYLAAKAWPEI
jgi:hypothetical protein